MLMKVGFLDWPAANFPHGGGKQTKSRPLVPRPTIQNAGNSSKILSQFAGNHFVAKWAGSLTFSFGHFRSEVEFLEKQLTDTQNKPTPSLSSNHSYNHQSATSSPHSNVMAKVFGVSCSLLMQKEKRITFLSYKMNFVAEQNAYYVSVESQVSINFILVQCNTDVQLVDIERNLAILSIIDRQKVHKTKQFVFVLRH